MVIGLVIGLVIGVAIGEVISVEGLRLRRVLLAMVVVAEELSLLGDRRLRDERSAGRIDFELDIAKAHLKA